MTSDSSRDADLSAALALEWSEALEPLPDYRLIRLLGRGGMGEVWEARGPGGVPIALKRVSLTGPCGRRELEALELLKRVRHPHLLALHAYWVLDNLLIMSCELADESLQALLQRQQQSGASGLAREQVLRYLNDAAEALDYLGRPIHRVNSHTVGIQHRDVKPANLLLQGGGVKVADFGLAKALQALVDGSSLSMTPAYAPPELFSGDLRPTSDQYSLGVSYYELRTGQLPFRGTPAEIMRGHLIGEPNLEGLTGREREVVSRALAKNPELRWASCVKFLGEIYRSEPARPGAIVPSFLSAKQIMSEQDAVATTATLRGRPIMCGQLLLAGELIPVPLRRTDVRATITGGTAEVVVTQHFVNKHATAIDTSYVFPLPGDAVVYKLAVNVEERSIEGVVREAGEAREMYEHAAREGHGAVLAEEQEANLFRMTIANVLPGQTVRVELTYCQSLHFQGGQYRFVFPAVVPPCPSGEAEASATDQPGEAPAAAAMGRLPHGMLRGDTFHLEIDLDAGVTLCGFDSPSHDIVVAEETGASRVRIALRRSDEIPNRDFVLSYRVAGPQIEHALFYEPATRDEEGTFLLLTTPPVPEFSLGLAREVILVVDCSTAVGSEVHNQVRQVAQQFLDWLNPQDTFDIVATGETVRLLAAAPLNADESQLRKAREFLDRLQANDTDALGESLQVALQLPRAEEPARVRTVIVLATSSFPEERELLACLRPLVGSTRIVAFGIGNAVNRHLFNKLALVGRGFAEFLGPRDNIARAVDGALRRLGQALLTDVYIDGGSGDVRDVAPDPCPDVFRDYPLSVMGRFHDRMPERFIVRGKLAGMPYVQEIPAAQARRVSQRLGVLWARRQIESLLDAMWEEPQRAEEFRGQVVALAKRYRLASPFTSFLAVDYRLPSEREESRGGVAVKIPLYSPSWAFADRLFAKSESLECVLDCVVAPTSDMATLARELLDPCLRDIAQREALSATTDAAGEPVSSLAKTPPDQASRGTAPEAKSRQPSRKADVQKRLQRVRRARCNLAYETFTNGSAQWRELPFVVGVVGDFSGHGDPPPLQDRQFLAIDRDNFDDAMKRLGVRLSLRVPNVISTDRTDRTEELKIDLRFESLEDFEPVRIARQVESLGQLLDANLKLQTLADSMAGSAPPSQIPLLQAQVRDALSRQFSAILHHPEFRRLEEAWRGLRYLVGNTETGTQIIIKVLQCSKRDFGSDLLDTPLAEQTIIRQKIITDEWQTSGGEPYGLLIGDFQFSRDHGDLESLTRMAKIAAEACCPFLTAASPEFFGLEDWSLFQENRGVAHTVDAYASWNAFRDMSESRYVALTAPRALARRPYGSEAHTTQLFSWDERSLRDCEWQPVCSEDLCWMNSAYVVGARLTEAFSRRGLCIPDEAGPNSDRGQVVEPIGHGLEWFETHDQQNRVRRVGPFEIELSPQGSDEFAREGLLALSLRDDGSGVGQMTTCRRPAAGKGQEITVSDQLAARLPCVIVTGRFAHYVRAIAAERLNRGEDPETVQEVVANWLGQYVDAGTVIDERIRFPLIAAAIEMSPDPARPNSRIAVLTLQLQPEAENAAVKTRLQLNLN